MLTWWQGYTNNGSGRGEGVIYNASYQQIATVQAANGLQGMDLHEFLVTPQGDAYIVGVSPIRYGTMKRPLMDWWSRKSTSRPGWSCSSGTRSTTSRSARRSSRTERRARCSTPTT